MALLPAENTLTAFNTAQNKVKKNLAGFQQAQTGTAAQTGARLQTFDVETPEIEQKIKTEQDKTSLQSVAAEQAKTQQQQQMSQQTLQLKEKALTVKEQLKSQTEDLLQKFEQQADLLDMDRYKSEVEQVAFGLRMQKDKYIDQLKLEGARSRLDSKAKFAEAMAATVYGDELDLLKNDTAFKRLSGLQAISNQRSLDDDDLAFKKEVGMMDIETALKIAAAESDARNTSMKYGAITDFINIYGTYKGATAAREKKDTAQTSKA
jgi:hypothetical protein